MPPRTQKLTVDIEANDKASAKIDKVADKADKLDKQESELDVDADVSRVLAAIDEVVADAKAVEAAAERMGQALGPELAAQADTTRVVQHLRDAGLSVDTISMKADELGVKLREAASSDVGGSLGASLGTARGKLDEVSRSADSSKSALANMIGNSTQDVAALGGVAGSTGVLLGQMGEYMADASFEGERLGSVVRNFAAVAGPALALGAAIQVVSGLMADQKRQAEEAAARTKLFGEAMEGASDDAVGVADALRENLDLLTKFDSNRAGSNWLGALADGLEDVGQHLPLVGGAMGDFAEGFTDLTPTLRAAGLSIYDLSKAIDGSAAGWEAFQLQLIEAKRQGKITEEQATKLELAVSRYEQTAHDASQTQALFNVEQDEANALLQEMLRKEAPLEHFRESWAALIEDMRDGTIDTKAAADAINLLAVELGLTREQVIELARAEDKGTDTSNEYVEMLIKQGLEQKRATEAAEREKKAIDDAASAKYRAANATFELHDREDALADAIENTAEVMADEESSLRDVRNAMEDTIQTADGLAQFQVEQAGLTLESKAGMDAWATSMLGSASTMDGPLRDAIADHVARVLGIPPEQVTEILAELDGASLEDIERIIAEFIDAPRNPITISTKVDGRTIGSLLSHVPPTPRRNNGGANQHARGTDFAPGGRSLVGEEGPEVVDLPRGSKVHNARKTRRMLNNGGTTNIVVHMPTGTRPEDVVALAARWKRRNGEGT